MGDTMKLQNINRISIVTAAAFAISFFLPAIDFNTDMVGNMGGWECAWTCLLFSTEVFDGNFWGLFGTALNAMAGYLLIAEVRSWRAGRPIPARLWPGQMFVVAAIINGVAWQFFDPTAELLIGHYLWVASILALTVGYCLKRLPVDRMEPAPSEPRTESPR